MGMKRILAVHTVRVPFLSYVIETTLLHDQLARTHFKVVQLCTSLCLRVKHVSVCTSRSPSLAEHQLKHCPGRRDGDHHRLMVLMLM